MILSKRDFFGRAIKDTKRVVENNHQFRKYGEKKLRNESGTEYIFNYFRLNSLKLTIQSYSSKKDKT